MIQTRLHVLRIVAVLGLASACQKDPPPKPVVSNVVPPTALTPGGTQATIQGSNFDGATSVTFGGTAATAVQVKDGSSIVCTVPAHARGLVPVAVTTEGGTGSLDTVFKYLQPVAITGVEPAMIQGLRATSIIIRGSGLVAPVTVTLGEGVGATTVTARAGTESAVPVDLPPLEPGNYTVKVTNADLQEAISATPLVVTLPPQPMVGSVMPSRGPTAGGTPLQIQGQNFSGATEVRFGSALAINPQVNPTGTVISVAAPAVTARGPVTVTVTTPSGTGTLAAGYRYVAPVVVTGLSPQQITANVAVSNVTINGSGMVAPVSARLSDGTNPIIDLVVNYQSDTTAVAVINSLPAGDYNVTVTNGDGESAAAPQALRVRAGFTLSAVYPAAGYADETTTLEITGPDLTGATAVLVGGVACGSFALVTGQRVSCEAPPHAAGAVDVVVQKGNISEGVLTGGFTYVSPTSTAVKVLGVFPAAGPSTGGVNVEVGIAGLAGRSPQVTIGGAPANIVNSSARTVTVALPPHSLTGGLLSERVDVVATIGAETDTATGAFRYYLKPSLTSITPNKGATVGGDEVTITGQGFSAENMRVYFDSAEATDVVRTSGTSLHCKIPAHALGQANVTLQNEFGAGPEAVNAFEFVDAVRIVSLTPPTFSLAGNTLVEAVGSGFAAGRMDLTLVEDNVTITDITVVSATRMRFVTPPRATAGNVTLHLQDSARVGQPFSSGDVRAAYVDSTVEVGAVGGGDIFRNVSVTVLRDDTHARIPGASVFIGDAWGSATYKGTTDARGMVVLSGFNLMGPITITAAGTGFGNETIVDVNAAEITFALTPYVKMNPTLGARAEISGTIINWEDAGYPQGAQAGRYKRIAAIYPSEPEIGESQLESPGPLIVISEDPCDVTGDFVDNPLNNQFTINARAGKNIALMAVVYFYDSVDGVCAPNGQAGEQLLPVSGAAVGILSDLVPVAGTNSAINITLNLSLTGGANVNFVGAPTLGGAGSTARTVDAFLELGESGVFTFLNPVGTQGTVSFNNATPQAGYNILPAGFEALASIPTGIPAQVGLTSTLRAVSATPISDGMGGIAGYKAPLSEAYLRDPPSLNVNIDGFFDFISGFQPAQGGTLASNRIFRWNQLSNTSGIVAISVEKITGFDGQGEPITQLAWTVIMPGTATQVALPSVAGAAATSDVTPGGNFRWILRGIRIFDEDNFAYDNHTTDVFRQSHWRAQVATAGNTFAVQ